LINKGSAPVSVDAQTPGSSVELDRLTPYDPTGAGRTLDAPDVRLDGRAVAADGSYPGLAPTVVGTAAGRLTITLGPGEAVAVTPRYAETEQTSAVGATVSPTLSLALGSPASFGTFAPGVDRDYDATTTATLISSAGDATLSVSDTATTAPGRLVNGSLSLAAPLQARSGSTPFTPIGTPLTLRTYTSPVSNQPAAIDFRQHIGANEPLRTGTYTKTLTFTLSTTNP
jgi:hypothetical protein